MSSWSAPDFLDQLKVLLDARAGLTGLTPDVRVLTYWPSASESITDAIILFGAEDSAESVIMNPSTKPTDERVNIEGEIRVVRPGAGEDDAVAARNRAQVLLNELDDQLRDTPPAVVHSRRASVASRRLDQFGSFAGQSETPVRVCLLSFTIEYRARTTTS